MSLAGPSRTIVVEPLEAPEPLSPPAERESPSPPATPVAPEREPAHAKA